MNKNDFNRFIGAGLVPGSADLEGARELTGLFPWFHSAHLVLLRGLRESSDIKFESQLKGSALYVADRSMLYHYLFLNVPERAEAVPVGVPDTEQVVESSEPGPEPEIETPEPLPVVEISETEPEIETPEPLPVVEISETEPEIETPDPLTVVEIIETEPEIETPEPLTVVEISETEPEIIVEVPEEITDTLSEEPGHEEPPAEEQSAEDSSLKTRDELIAEIEARLVELKKEDLLELAEVDEITVDSVPDEGSPELAEPEEISIDSVTGEGPEFSYTATEETPIPEEPLKQLSPNDLIDRFIQTSPRIERMVPGEVPLLLDITERRNEEHTPFITETLARIYVNQGYYTRAINIYEKLTLQFPEKSAYFASRIEKIKELIK